MKRIVFLIAALIAIFLSTQFASAQTKIRVRFPAGTHGTTVTGTIRGFAYKDYLVGAGAGQTIDLKLTSTGNPSVFSVFTPDGGDLEGAGEKDEFSGELPAKGDYVIRVFMMRTYARIKNSYANFKLKITIK